MFLSGVKEHSFANGPTGLYVPFTKLSVGNGLMRHVGPQSLDGWSDADGNAIHKERLM
jgi:hypothetical protein